MPHIKEFQEIVWAYAVKNTRTMPWRDNTDPYYVLVSELMLQQTQVDRVVPKFTTFIERFPDIASLAQAPLGDVLALWSGLGYNRRAKFLSATARCVVEEYDGTLPRTKEELIKLPGIGPNTAGAIMAYAYNQPVVYVETNIRTVFFHHFFASAQQVSDAELLEVAQLALDTEHPREWYWALMDYGTYLKKQGAGRIQQSTHYKKQSPLKGSVREVRGQIIKALHDAPLSEESLKQKLLADERFTPALTALINEGLVVQIQNTLHLP